MGAKPFAKGHEKIPGSGRPAGTVNRVTVELRALCGQLIHDPEYQRRLRADFRARKVHPLTEARVWEYHAGKPATEVNLNARIELTQRFELEAELLRGLDLRELEALAEESQALIDRAVARSKGRATLPLPEPAGETSADSADVQTLSPPLSEDIHRLSDDR